MLDKFETIVLICWEAIEGLEKLQFCCKFNRTKGDIRCCVYIYNLVVQVILKAIKAESKESRYYYKYITG
jgi:hypothetical protein